MEKEIAMEKPLFNTLRETIEWAYRGGAENRLYTYEEAIDRIEHQIKLFFPEQNPKIEFIEKDKILMEGTTYHINPMHHVENLTPNIQISYWQKFNGQNFCVELMSSGHCGQGAYNITVLRQIGKNGGSWQIISQPVGRSSWQLGEGLCQTLEEWFQKKSKL